MWRRKRKGNKDKEIKKKEWDHEQEGYTVENERKERNIEKRKEKDIKKEKKS